MYVAITQAARFAVPFFFVVSGYFFSKQLYDRNLVMQNSIRVVSRLFLLWLFWSLVYIFPFDLSAAFDQGALGPVKVAYSHLVNIKSHPIQVLFEGTASHLWFFMSLIWSTMIAAIFYTWLQRPDKPLIALAIALYVFGLCAKAYSPAPIGIDIAFNTRDGPFFGTIFFVMGLILSKYNIESRHFVYGLSILMAGYLVHFGEIYYLYITYKISPASHDFVIGTLLVGLGISIMALSNHAFLSSKWLSNIGKYTLGIYAVHYVFVDVLRLFDKQVSGPLWEIAYLIGVLGLSISVTLLASRTKHIKKFFV